VPLPRAIILIPVYNHVHTLRGVVKASLHAGFQVIVVDDGSTDGSLDTVTDLGITTHRLPVNRGKGAALLAGGRLAASQGYDAVISIDADGQHDPNEAHALLAMAISAWPAIILGARQMGSPNVPTSSRLGMEFSNFWVRLECGMTLPDTQSGFRLYPVALLTRTRYFSRRYTFEIEVLVRGSWAGLPVLSTPISVYYPPSGERISHFHKFRDNVRLSVLHAWLMTRSLVPWPHRCLFPGNANRKSTPSLLHPLRLLRQLSQEHNSPRDIATAVWLGIFIGSLPIIPFGLATILYVSHKLRLNKLAAAGASNICVAPFVPFICIEVGHLLRHGSWWTLFTHQTLVAEVHERAWEWLLGALVVGPALGGVGALLVYVLLKHLPRFTKRAA